MAFTVRVQGLEDLKSKLGRLDDNAARVNEAAVMKAGLIIQAGAQKRSPKRTGRNAASINTKLVGSGVSASADVSTGTDYGPFLEMGTARMAAQPYMRPALREEGPAAQRAYAEVMKGAIGK